MSERRLVVFLSHADEAALRLAGSAALTGVASGDRVDVFLFEAAVTAVVTGKDDPDHPAALLWQAKGGGGCRFLACSASVVREKLDLGVVNAAVDAVVGWPTVVEWTRGVADRFFF